jgi:hypothetical protein
MNTKEQLRDAPVIRQAKRRSVGLQSQSVTTRMLAAIYRFWQLGPRPCAKKRLTPGGACVMARSPPMPTAQLVDPMPWLIRGFAFRWHDAGAPRSHARGQQRMVLMR